MQSKSGEAQNHPKHISFKVSTPWYVSKSTIRNNLKIETVNQLATEHYEQFHSKLLQFHFTLESLNLCPTRFLVIQ